MHNAWLKVHHHWWKLQKKNIRCTNWHVTPTVGYMDGFLIDGIGSLGIFYSQTAIGKKIFQAWNSSIYAFTLATLPPTLHASNNCPFIYSSTFVLFAVESITADFANNSLDGGHTYSILFVFHMWTWATLIVCMSVVLVRRHTKWFQIAFHSTFYFVPHQYWALGWSIEAWRNETQQVQSAGFTWMEGWMNRERKTSLKAFL